MFPADMIVNSLIPTEASQPEHFSQEALVVPPHIAFAVRRSPGNWEFVKVSSDSLSVEGISTTDYLKFKEMIYDEEWFVVSLVSDFLSCALTLLLFGTIVHVFPFSFTTLHVLLAQEQSFPLS